MAGKAKVDRSDIARLQTQLIGLYEKHGDSGLVADELGISQSRLSEIVALCGLKLTKRLVQAYNIIPLGQEVGNG